MLANLTEAIQHLISNLYGATGLLGIILAMAIESCCLPLPSEIVMPLAGIMIYNQNHFPGLNYSWPLWVNLIIVALAGALGCLLGSIAAYGIGYRGGRPLMLKYGKYVLISQHDADVADRFFAKYGNATAFISRLLPIVRTYISLPAGIAKTHFPTFCLFTFLGSFPWCLVLAYLGYVLGGNLNSLSTVFHGLDIVIAVVLVALVALYIWRHVRNDRKARAEHATREAQEAQTSNNAFQQTTQQNWNQQNQPQGWNQQNQPYPNSQQQNWNQPSQQPSPYQQSGTGGNGPQFQQPRTPTSSQQFQAPQQQWGQQPFPQQNGQNWPPASDDHTIRR